MTMTRFQAGFSAIELLITMFIAVAFIGAGYQLYGVAIKDGNDARLRAQASSLAYSNLRIYSAKATNPCSVFTPSPTPALPANSGLTQASIQVTPSCPYGTTSSVTAVTVTVSYGNPQQEVTHALYVTPQ